MQPSTALGAPSTVADAVDAKPSAAFEPGAKSLIRQLIAELEHKVSARHQ